MTKIAILVSASIFFTSLVLNSQTIRISGRVSDKEDSTISLSGVLFLEPGNKSSIIDSKGQYSFSCNPGEIQITTRIMGYESASISIKVLNDTVINIYITPQPFILDEVLAVSDSVKNIKVSRLGNYYITPLAVRETPKFFSEPDLLKSFQLLPGVLPGKDGSSEIFVRGGNSGQNIAIANGCYFFIPGHLLGFISPFDLDFLESAELIKDYFPAEFGGGASSVIKLDYRKPDSDTLSIQIRAGLLSSGMQVEIPLKKIKSGITSGFRLGNYPLYARFLKKISGPGVAQYLPSDKYLFLDGYFQFNYSTAKAGEINYLFFGNLDNGNQETKTESNTSDTIYASSQGVKIGWNSMVHSIQWIPPSKSNRSFRVNLNYNRVSMNREIYQSSQTYTSEAIIESVKFTNTFSPSINNFGSSLVVNLKKGKTQFSGGLSNRFRIFSPNVIASIQEIDALTENKLTESTLIIEPSLFLSTTFFLKNIIQVDAGLRLAGGITNKAHFFHPEPRVRLSFNPEGNISPHINFVTISQFDHSLEGTNTGLRATLWLPMSKNFGPEKSNVLSTGVQVHTDKSLIFTIDGYIKETSGMVDFKPGASFIYDYSFDDMLERTKGRAVGIETGIIKSKGKLSGAFTYTYSRSKREWSAATGTIWIPTSADRPHNLNLSIKYFFNQKVSFGLNWVYISGAPATIYTHSTGDEEWYESKNNIRYFPYHRLDLSLRKIFYFKKFSMFLDLDINNVYNRKNTFYFKEMYDPVDQSRYYKNISLFPIMPSLSLTIKF